MLPKLNDVLQCLSLNGYSVFSLIDDVLSQGCNQEDPRIKLLREGVERDAASICARLLNHNSASASVSAWALGFAQATTMTLPLWNNNVVSPGLSSGVAWTSTGGPERFLNMGRVLSKNYRYGVTIDVLPDNVFLDIFDFCLRDSTAPELEVIQPTKKWQVLVHVCQRWRRIIFASPRRLDLHLSCSYGTRVRRNLGSWPATLPLTIDYTDTLSSLTPRDEDSIIFALKRTSRVHRIDIHAPGLLSRKVADVMRRSFPVLTHLYLAWDLDDESRGVSSVIPSRFLGGSAPHLQHFRLRNVSFPDLPTFLLSARNLITLKVENICTNGYISPEAMVGGLAVLTRLISLSITFDEDLEEEPPSPSDHPDPPMRITLPALTAFHYRGDSEYLEDFLAQIDTPRVHDFRIEYLAHEEIQATQLSRFIDRTENLKLDQFNRAKVNFYFFYAQVEINSSRPQREHEARLTLVWDRTWLDAQLRYVVQVLGQLAHTFSHLDYLDAHGDGLESNDIPIAEWLPFFHLFPVVETLHLSRGALHLIWLDDMDSDDGDEPVGSIERFLTMRQRTGFPVTVVYTEDEFYRRR
ncbi:hypothetical protein EDB92DRAFT_1949290 [Lactarius akahatsu]|uniref:Uncharacterized protein n=1 Tax=Lactarius akahatsu TaxID=416441 RepID=A0AAD4QAY6_9AGAM|nr:hypothetical protein EDB92DRAFT_1949290 [Lactarius akahatsu]